MQRFNPEKILNFHKHLQDDLTHYNAIPITHTVRVRSCKLVDMW